MNSRIRLEYSLNSRYYIEYRIDSLNSMYSVEQGLETRVAVQPDTTNTKLN